MINPVFFCTASPCPAATSSRQNAVVRRSCQTMALWIGFPLVRSHTTVVSRWLVMPTATMSAAAACALSSTAFTTATVARQISSASCSTQPSAG
jgi:hypothetical protein